MKLLSALASVSVLMFAGAAFAQDQPAPPPSQPVPPAQPAAAPAAPQAAPAYGKGWNAKKCADAKAKSKTIPDGACPDEAAPK